MKFLGVELDVIKLAIRNTTNTFKSTFTNAATSDRTITLQDKSYTLAGLDDLSNPALSAKNVYSGGNLVANGLGESGTNYNFSGFSVDTAYGSPGSALSFYRPKGTGTYVDLGDSLINIPAQKLLNIAADIILGDIDGSNYSSSYYSYGLIGHYDSSGLLISDYYGVSKVGAVNTTLAAQLNPGDTTIQLVDSTGWENPTWYQTYLQYWPWNVTLNTYAYVEASGKINLPYTYTRNISDSFYPNPAWTVSGNTLTLNSTAYPSGWTGATLQAGTPVRCGAGGGGNLYWFVKNTVGLSTYSKTLTGNNNLTADLYLYYGVAKITIKLLHNDGSPNSSTGSSIRVSNLLLQIK